MVLVSVATSISMYYPPPPPIPDALLVHLRVTLLGSVKLSGPHYDILGVETFIITFKQLNTVFSSNTLALFISVLF